MSRHPEDMRLVFLDLETMGLAPIAPIVEIGMIVADMDERGGGLKSIAEFNIVVAHNERTWRERADPFCVETHGRNGLRAESVTAMSARAECMDRPDLNTVHFVYPSHEEDLAIEFLKAHQFAEGTAVIAGSSVHTDRRWLEEQMPRLNGFLHPYKLIDVSAFRGIVTRYVDARVRSVVPSNDEHRAMPDCRDSLAELNMYVRALFTNQDRGVSWTLLKKYGRPRS